MTVTKTRHPKHAYLTKPRPRILTCITDEQLPVFLSWMTEALWLAPEEARDIYNRWMNGGESS